MKVFRPKLSEYLTSDFRSHEKNKLESIEGITYIPSWDDSPDILLTNTSTEIDHDKIWNVRLIVHANSGHEPFDKSFVERFSGIIVRGNVIRTQAVVQYIISCLFQRYGQAPFSSRWDTKRRWNRKLLEEFKILLIGYGHIGRQLASVLTSLNASPRIYDPWQGHDQLDVHDADIIILCCSSNVFNKHLINKHFLNKISPEATLINSARGDLVDEVSLLHFLDNNPQAFAFLDVQEKEPPTLKKFLNLNNISTSSHVAGVYKNIEQNIINFEYTIIKKFAHSPEALISEHSESLLTPSSFVE